MPVQAIKLIKSLFSRAPKSAELREQMKKLEDEKASLRYDQRGLDRERSEAFERAKTARKRGDNTEILFHLQELKGLDQQRKLIMREVQRANKALIVLGHYARRLERLERNNDYGRIAKYIERFRTSDSMAKIEEASVSEDMFQEILDEELGEIDRELGLVGGFDALDDEMKGMLDAVDAVIEAEREGDLDRARKTKQSMQLSEEDPLSALDKAIAEERAAEPKREERPNEARQSN